MTRPRRVGLGLWALALARNLCLDRLRARQRRARVIVENLETPDWEAAAAPESAAPTTWSGPDGVVVQNAVRELPGDQRRAIELAFFDGLTHQEIAAALNEPLGTIKARVRRGMLKLRAGLEQLL